MMAGHALVIRQRTHAGDAQEGPRHRRPKDTRQAAVPGRAGVVGSRRLFGQQRLAPHLDRRLGRDVEQQFRALLGIAQHGRVAGQQLGACLFKVPLWL